MTLTFSFIRSLSGASEAELPDVVLEDLQVIDIANTWYDSLDNTITDPISENIALYYKGYKCIVLLELYLLTALPEKIKDNFNELTRFDTIKDVIALAKQKLLELENPVNTLGNITRFDIVSPTIDPVTQEGR